MLKKDSLNMNHDLSVKIKTFFWRSSCALSVGPWKKETLFYMLTDLPSRVGRSVGRDIFLFFFLFDGKNNPRDT